MKRPEWAQAKARLGLATCWVGKIDGEWNMRGVNWMHEILFSLTVHFYNYLVLPFCEETPGFPVKIVERYDKACLQSDDIEFWEEGQ